MSENVSRAQLEADLASVEQQLRSVMLRQAGAIAYPSDLTLRQLQTLGLLHGATGMTGQVLADLLEISTPTVSGLIDRLVVKGLVARTPDQSDRRRVMLTLSEHGVDVLVQLDAAGRIQRDALLRELPVADVAHLHRIFSQLLAIASRGEAAGNGNDESPTSAN
ncbi:MarR family transcriptional regulator [Ornithinimicrobium sp. Arc0846-15]|nr:MarR family transcriptional regulator [Ornithinimicrobium laminariae]